MKNMLVIIKGTRRKIFKLLSRVRDEKYLSCYQGYGMKNILVYLRVRDEMRMTIHAAETLYTSSIAFGIRQVIYVVTEIPNKNVN